MGLNLYYNYEDREPTGSGLPYEFKIVIQQKWFDADGVEHEVEHELEYPEVLTQLPEDEMHELLQENLLRVYVALYGETA